VRPELLAVEIEDAVELRVPDHRGDDRGLVPREHQLAAVGVDRANPGPRLASVGERFTPVLTDRDPRAPDVDHPQQQQHLHPMAIPEGEGNFDARMRGVPGPVVGGKPDRDHEQQEQEPVVAK